MTRREVAKRGARRATAGARPEATTHWCAACEALSAPPRGLDPLTAAQRWVAQSAAAGGHRKARRPSA